MMKVVRCPEERRIYYVDSLKIIYFNFTEVFTRRHTRVIKEYSHYTTA